MADIAQLTKAYVRHALQLIRLANGMNAESSADLRGLGLALRQLLLGQSLSGLGFRSLRKIVSEADALIHATFDKIAERATTNVKELIDIETQWAKQAGRYDVPVSDARLAQLQNQFTVMGNTIDEHFDTMATRLSREVKAQVRLGVVGNQSDGEIVARAVGTGRVPRGGPLEKTARSVRAMNDSVVQGAGDVGRRASMNANGVNAFRWHAVLDSHVCPSCGERADKVWLADGTPVSHDIPYAPVPLHVLCRCILLPLSIPQKVLDKGLPASDTFNKFLDGLDEAEQDEILGKGRAKLWRDGTISTSDLIGQNGQTLTLADLRAQL